MGNFFAQQIRQLLFTLDQIVYPLIGNVYELIIYLSNVDLVTNNEIVKGLISRIYLLLGIFMLFKVSFSLIQYLIDPNSFSDKSKGFGKLITNALVALVLLVNIPFIFTEAYKLQGLIINSNVIGNLILGEKMEDYSKSDNPMQSQTRNISTEQRQEEIRSMAKDVEFALFGAFYSLNTSNSSAGVYACNPQETNYPGSNIIGSVGMAQTCLDAFKSDAETEMNRYNATLQDYFKYCNDDECSDLHDERNFSAFGKLLYWQKAGSDTDFTINYTPIVSAIAGGYVLLLLITFCIDIAVRAFKLMFLQAIAPIAVVAYIDPKESSSNSKLYRWTMECVKTYVSLFLRLAVIYLAIKLVQMLTSIIFVPVDSGGTSVYYEGIQPDAVMNIWVYVFLILGIFTFAKKVPQMIESIFNLKLAGEMNLNPFKALGENVGATALIGGAVGGAASSLASGATALAQGKGFLGTAKSAMAGGVAGTFRGGAGGFKGKNVSGALKAGLRSGGISARNKQMKGEMGIDYLRHPIQSARKSMIKGASRASDRIGGPTPGQILKGRVSRYDNVASAGKAYQEAIENNSKASDAQSSTGKSYKAEFASLQNKKDYFHQQYINGQMTNDAYTKMIGQIGAKEKQFRDEYRNDVMTGNINDYEVKNAHATLEDLRSGLDVDSRSINSLDDIKAITTDAKNKSAEHQNSDLYRESVQVGETIENLNKERFYETGGRGQS